jgi:cytochrome oxidase assembly protein ShyY1
VSVTGRVRRPESGADRARAVPGDPAARLEVRRIAPDRIAGAVPYRLYGAYVTLDAQTPPADAAFTAIPADHENALQNAGYVVQWWAFAALTLFGYGYLARREAHQDADEHPDGAVLTTV